MSIFSSLHGSFGIFCIKVIQIQGSFFGVSDQVEFPELEIALCHTLPARHSGSLGKKEVECGLLGRSILPSRLPLFRSI